jgi:hypothetical protein
MADCDKIYFRAVFVFSIIKRHDGGYMKKGKMAIWVVFFVSFFFLEAIPGRAQAENEKPVTRVHSVLVICPFPQVEKRQVVENAFVKALIKMTGLKEVFPYIGTLSRGEEITREEFIKGINEKKIESLLFIQIKGIASNLDRMGGSPDPFSPASEEDEPEGGVYVPKGRAAKTWFQASLVNFKTGKSLWKEQTKVLGDIWLSLNSVSKSMAKKTAKSLNKTGLLESR